MCSLRANQLVLDSFANLTRAGVNADNSCQRKLIRFAAEANTQHSGPLDNHSGCLRHMPEDLKHIRHYTVGVRHHVFVSGHHKNCQYLMWYVKEFKRAGRDVEGSKGFNRTLYAALNEAANYILTLDEKDDVVIEDWVDPESPDNEKVRA